MARFRSSQSPEDDEPPMLGEDVVVVVDSAVHPYLVLFHDPTSFRAEQIRALRNKLQAMNPDGEPKTLVVTSAARGEGKTTVACNLAMAMAELERHEVVLVDADLRQPSVERWLNLNPGPGLSDLLTGQASLAQVLRPAGFRRLSLIGAGSRVENPAQVLSVSRIDDLYARLKERFRYVVLDTPPVLPSTDASVLAARADGTLLVLRLERTTRSHAKEAVRTLQDLGANVLGSFVVEVRGIDPESDRRLKYGVREDEVP